MSSGSLTLPEEVLLLALRDKEGTIHSGATYQFAMAGALLAELLLHERVRVLPPKSRRLVKERLVDVVSREAMGEPLLDEALDRIAQARRRGSVRTWVSRLSGMKRLKHRIAERLVERGVLRASDATVLLIFTRTVYPERDPKPERELVARLRRAIFTSAAELDARTVVLVALSHPTGLLRANFDKKKLRERKKRIERIVAGDAVGQATKEVMEAVRAAMMAAAVASTVAATVH